MFVITRFIVIAAAALAAASPVRADEILDAALAAGRVERAESHAFDWRLARDGEEPFLARFDPRDMGRPWRLIRVNGAAPSDADRDAFQEDPPSRYNPVGYAAVAALISEPTFLREMDGVRVYRFRPNPDAASSGQEASLYPDLTGEIRLRAGSDAPWIETVRIFAETPFKPAPPAKITVYERTFTFAPWNSVTETPRLLAFEATTEGRVFFDPFRRHVRADVLAIEPVELPPGR